MTEQEAQAEQIAMIYEARIQRVEVDPEDVGAFLAGGWLLESEWERSRLFPRVVEAAPSDTDRPSSLELRRMTEDERAEAIMQYLADSLGDLGYELDSHEDTAEFLQHVSAGFSRASQPVQVEVTEAELNVLAQRFYEASGLNIPHTSKPEVVAGLRAAFGALGGGGDHAE